MSNLYYGVKNKLEAILKHEMKLIKKTKYDNIYLMSADIDLAKRMVRKVEDFAEATPPTGFYEYFIADLEVTYDESRCNLSRIQEFLNRWTPQAIAEKTKEVA